MASLHDISQRNSLNLQKSLNDKATVDEVNSKLVNITSQVKHDLYALDALKAEQTSFETLQDELQKQFETKAETAQLQEIYNELTTALDDKAEREELLSFNHNIHESLKLKAEHKDFELYLQTVNYAKEYIKLSQQNMQNLIDEAKKRLPDEVISTQQLQKITDEEKHKFDTFYVEFEDKFRGSREDIKERVEVYLPYLEKLPFRKEEILALDVGCGRGEWLELLKEESYSAKGLDLNRVMVSKSKALGLDVIEYLCSLESESLSIITGFHIIEHLPFEVLMKLFEESYRVLKKGGMVIFETPNPENLTVGACNFYMDPTHINPLVPISIEFIITNQKFKNVSIKKLHSPENLHFEDSFINHQFNVGQDFAVIGYKK
ncbi:class I SAM-dependent methyltransferase [Candidatus Acidulodesulfobacterium sp. H_13]|uniref:class I SAM-dependent methyltransferase n=1 Tax=Candidatus Acidulodesulfobacterium sp. H_13 TaxID=3395470 RepID=UPI003AF5D0EB